MIAPPADSEHFMFAVAGDNRSTGHSVSMPPTARQVFSELRLLQPAFCLWSGDTIYGYDDTAGEVRSEYAAFLSEATASETPVICAPGNHEINNRKDMEDLYEATMGPLYGSFDYGRSHFIAIDTEEAGGQSGVGPAQLQWLRDDLSAHRGANIFVFSHHPLFPHKKTSGFSDQANRDEVHRLFVQYAVKCVFSGHEHLYYRSEHDGVTYVVTGGAGAPSELPPDKGGFQHYILVYVNGSEVTMSILEPWRIFSEYGPALPDGSCTARLDNYAASDLSLVAEFPTDTLREHATSTASFTYKGKTFPLASTIVPARRAGSLAVRVTVPSGRSANVSIAPAPKPAAP